MKRKALMVLPTDNPAWGFFGTVATERGEAVTEREWRVMSRRCLKAGLAPVECRDFLDSRMGRHLADQILERKVSATELKKDFISWWQKEQR